jgi:hypothetical protein
MCRTLIEDLEMKFVSAKIIPQMLTQEQKENCLSVASECLACAEMKFIYSIIKCDLNPY